MKPGERVMQLAGNEGLFPQTRAQARLLSETRGAPGWRNIPPWVGEFEVRSTIVLPLVLHGETYGCLGIGSSTPAFYDERSFRLALAFGDRIAQALLNARSFTLERQRARAAEQLVFLRNDFVAAVSHELRTPLSAILGYGEVLQAHWDKLTDKQRQARIGRMVVAANRQKRLIDDLLQVSSLEASVPIVSRESVRLADVLARAVEMVEDSYAGQCIEVKGDTDLCVQADPAYAERILINLLDNAAKYSPEGSPIQVRLAGSGPTISIRVQDLGSGIPSDYLPVLFTRFGRVPGSHMRSGRVGTGLGLYLARQYAQAMHGNLVLEGTSPTGSVFRLDLPAGENA
jgi:two-component system sensor histidine kinase KdpD